MPTSPTQTMITGPLHPIKWAKSKDSDISGENPTKQPVAIMNPGIRQAMIRTELDVYT